MKSTPTLSIGRETLVSTGSKALMAAVGFGGTLVFANVLGDVGLGEYRTVLAAAMVLTQIPAGVAVAVKKRVSEIDTDAGGYLGLALLFHGGFTVLVLVLFFALEPWLSPFFGSDDLAIGVVGIVGALGLFNVTNQFYSGTGHPALSTWIDALRSVLTLAFQVAFLLWGFAAFGVVVGFALATAVTAIVSGLAARVRPIVPTLATARRVHDFARWSVPNSLLTNIYSGSDALIVRAVAGPSAVGYYTVGATLAQPGAMFAGSIRDALSVKSSGVDSAGGDVRADLANSLSYTGLLAIPLFFGAHALAGPLLTVLFGPEFADAPTLVVTGMAIYQAFNVFRQPFEAVAEGTDRPNLIFRVNVFVVVVHVPLALGLGFAYGLLGVVASTVVAEGLRVVVYQYVAHREFGGAVVTRPIFEQVFAGALMYGVVEAVEGGVIGVSWWFPLLTVVSFGAVVYFAVLVAVSAHFRTTLRYTLPFLQAPSEA